jgi:hypothetical protein
MTPSQRAKIVEITERIEHRRRNLTFEVLTSQHELLNTLAAMNEDIIFLSACIRNSLVSPDESELW